MTYIYSVNGQEKKGPFESVDALVASIRERQFVSKGTEDLIRTHFSTTNTESKLLEFLRSSGQIRLDEDSTSRLMKEYMHLFPRTRDDAADAWEYWKLSLEQPENG